MKESSSGKQPKSKVRELIESILMALVIAAFVIAFVVQAFKIPSSSMVPTLLVGDHLFVNKFIYGVKIPILRKTILPVGEPKRGDVIVFIFPQDRSKDFIKRVIGVGGDKIEIKSKKIYLNDRLYQDAFGVYSDDNMEPADKPRDFFGPVTVPKGSLFVMGDNRDHSHDSRFWGFVNLKDVKGKAFIIHWSWDAEDKTVRWSRIGQWIK